MDDENVNDVEFKDALVMQDIQPIGGLCRVVLGTIMEQQWVPYEYKALLFCFAPHPGWLVGLSLSNSAKFHFILGLVENF